jgi:acetoin utilization deacetylase AcuC-like enzyme
MTTALLSHTACLYHEMPPGHPEQPDRLRAVLARLEGPEFTTLARHEAPLATREQLSRVHPPDYVDAMLRAVPARGLVQVDGDTILSPGSGEAALRAAGAAVAAVDLLAAGRARRVFCAVRPPGHHAEPAEAMGFCLFNNVAVAAMHARAVYGWRRVAVLDFDVHHGNGTQALFERDPEAFFGSTHQMPLYPGTGARHERGLGNIVNVPLPPGAGSAAFRTAWEETIIPALTDFRADCVLISAGFDAHHADPLASLELTEADFAWVTGKLCAAAALSAQGRVVSTLEGGYDLAALAASCAAHVSALMEH